MTEPIRPRILATRVAKTFAKKMLPKRIRDELRILRQLSGYIHYPQVPFDNTYPWLNWAFSKVKHNASPLCKSRPQYIWGVAQGAALAKVLGETRISVIEFGVAHGAGLLALESIARDVSELTNTDIDVFGFDTGTGLPPPTDVRDQPNLWYGGQLPMDKERLLSSLTRAKLYLGPVKDTLQSFLRDHPPPIAFASFDMDLYSSTRDALGIFEADHTYLLPRVFSYFDDILGHTYNDYCGERLAISEFNSSHVNTKLCPIYGLRYFIPRTAYVSYGWPEGMFITHIFDHKRYNLRDSIKKPVSVEIDGTEVWEVTKKNSELCSGAGEAGPADTVPCRQPNRQNSYESPLPRSADGLT